MLEGLGYPKPVREAILEAYADETGFSGSRLPGTLVVHEAANVASSLWRGEETASSVSLTAPLSSIFNFVGQRRPVLEQRWSYFPREYGGARIDSYFPVKDLVEAGDESYRRLENKVARGLQELEGPSDVSSVMNLLERHGSYVRSTASAESGDVSLFDHSRTTAAVAVCIAGHLNATKIEPTRAEIERDDAERYLFVRGDLSGVQKFIYTLTSRGALRMLRARSFFLELLAEHAAADILYRSGVPRTNVIFVGGGGFQLLLPNTATSEKAVDRVGKELNDTLEDAFGEDLYLALARVSCGRNGIIGEGLGRTLGDLGRQLSELKARKFHESLPRLLDRQPSPEPESCDVCTRDDLSTKLHDPRTYGFPRPEGEETVRLCEVCGMLARASLKLARHGYLVGDGGDFRIGESGYELSGDGGRALYALDGVGDDACLEGAVPLPSARYALRDEKDRRADFARLSERAVGVPRLAVLRMDVDNLGNIFRSGLPEEMRTFSRYAALSRGFTTFFKMILPEICKGNYAKSLRLFTKERARAATVVYSGGDDLFIVGAWSDILELAVEVRRAFREFVCENPTVTLSAGISLHKPGEPLYLMAEAAGAAEETAKKNEQDGREKDSAVLFYQGADARETRNLVPQALFWDDIEEAVRLLQNIEVFRGPDGELPFPRGFTRLLLDVVDVYEQEGYLSLPRLAYALARMEEASKLGNDGRWQDLKKQLLDIQTIKKYLRPAAYWLDLAEREGEEE